MVFLNQRQHIWWINEKKCAKPTTRHPGLPFAIRMGVVSPQSYPATPFIVIRMNRLADPSSGNAIINQSPGPVWDGSHQQGDDCLIKTNEAQGLLPTNITIGSRAYTYLYLCTLCIYYVACNKKIDMGIRHRLHIPSSEKKHGVN